MIEIVHVPPAPVSPLAREERVRMRDGVHLAADVYLPGAPDAADTAPGDTVLIRLPYDKSGEYTFIPLIAEYMTRRGWRVIAQDVRGKFRSEGEALLFVNEVDDGFDTIEWITRQPWSNGRVAMWGDSYYGYTQWAAAASGHPALKAIAPRVTSTMLGEPQSRDPGLRVRGVEQAITLLYPLTYFHSRDAWFWDLDPGRHPYSAQAEEMLAQVGSRSRSYDQWYPHPLLLPRFPLASPFDARPVPVLHTIGWWDNCAPVSWADVAEIARHPGWDALHHLRIESMDHESYYLLDPAASRVEPRPEEQILGELPRMLDPALDFFDVFVRGEGSARDIPRVAWNLAGTEGMRTTESWPPPGRSMTLWATGDGRLSPDVEAAAGALSWVHDPADPVPSTAPNAFAFLLHRPDEAPLGDRDDVLAFTADPVADDLDLVGPMTVTATVHSDGPVMDVFARVLDVAPDGTALRIARGQVQVTRARESTAVTVDCGQLGYRLRAGHRLRLHVSSSDAPEFLAQPGTGEDPWGAVQLRPNTQSIVVGGETGLRLVMSIATGEEP